MLFVVAILEMNATIDKKRYLERNGELIVPTRLVSPLPSDGFCRISTFITLVASTLNYEGKSLLSK